MPGATTDIICKIILYHYRTVWMSKTIPNQNKEFSNVVVVWKGYWTSTDRSSNVYDKSLLFHSRIGKSLNKKPVSVAQALHTPLFFFLFFCRAPYCFNSLMFFPGPGTSSSLTVKSCCSAQCARITHYFKLCSWTWPWCPPLYYTSWCTVAVCPHHGGRG